ncbi:MAG: hypothetical protein ACYS6K_03790 [Planctomycetota bacterium]
MFNISSNLTITNSIFWLNEDRVGTNESTQIFGGTPVVNYNCIQGWTGGLGGTDDRQSIDPMENRGYGKSRIIYKEIQ